MERANGTGRCLVFEIEGETFCLDVKYVEVVLEMQLVTKVPKSDPHLRGVINHRGSVVPVVDLKRRLGIGSTDLAKDPSIIVASLQDGLSTMTIGLLADSVREVIEVDVASVSKAEELGMKVDEEILAGIVKREDEFILMLDLEALMERDAIAGGRGS
jgi:purine-binding chemotaxis protein CheW